MNRLIRRVASVFGWIIAACLSLWVLAALYFDLSIPRSPFLTPILYVGVLAYLAKRGLPVRSCCIAGFFVVLVCWLSLKPSNNRPWQLNVAGTPWAEIKGDLVVIHNLRDCAYQTEEDYRCRWLDKTLSLAQLSGLDLFVTYWGSPYIAHPILSFRFGGNDHVAVSIEARYQVGKGYSAIRGFFRQYELIYVFAGERDLIGLRTNYRKGEEVYLFHTTAGPDWSRKLFLEYLAEANQLHDHPQWYNAATRNCTTNIFTHMAATGQLPAGSTLHDWWILLNGQGPEILYRSGNFAGDLPYPELKERSHINAVARSADDSPDFSRLIRMGRPGFEVSNLPSRAAAPIPNERN